MKGELKIGEYNYTWEYVPDNDVYKIKRWNSDIVGIDTIIVTFEDMIHNEECLEYTGDNIEEVCEFLHTKVISKNLGVVGLKVNLDYRFLGRTISKGDIVKRFMPDIEAYFKTKVEPNENKSRVAEQLGVPEELLGGERDYEEYIDSMSDDTDMRIIALNNVTELLKGGIEVEWCKKLIESVVRGGVDV